MKIITDIQQLKELIELAQNYTHTETEPDEILEGWISNIKYKTENSETRKH